MKTKTQKQTVSFHLGSKKAFGKPVLIAHNNTITLIIPIKMKEWIKLYDAGMNVEG